MKFQLEDGTDVDLTAPGKTFTIRGGWFNRDLSYMVIVRMPFSYLQTIAASNSLRIEALGFILDMESEDIQSLRRYVKTVQNGVRLSPLE